METSLCDINWDATGSMLAALAAWAGVIAVIWAAKQGRDAVADWRSQKLIERHMDTAERALTAAYRLKSAIEGIRASFISASELSRAERDLEAIGLDLADQPEERARRITLVQAIYNRANAGQTELDEVFAIIPLATAYFGAPLGGMLQEILLQRRRVLSAAEIYIDDDGANHDLSMQLRSKMFKGQTGSDPIADKVDEVVTALEADLLPLLRHAR